MYNIKQQNITLVPGSILTFKGEIIDMSGCIIFRPGDKVKVHEVIKSGGYWGEISGYWIDEKIERVKLDGYYGLFKLSCFVETYTTI